GVRDNGARQPWTQYGAHYQRKRGPHWQATRNARKGCSRVPLGWQPKSGAATLESRGGALRIPQAPCGALHPDRPLVGPCVAAGFGGNKLTTSRRQEEGREIARTPHGEKTPWSMRARSRQPGPPPRGRELVPHSPTPGSRPRRGHGAGVCPPNGGCAPAPPSNRTDPARQPHIDPDPRNPVSSRVFSVGYPIRIQPWPP